MRLVFVLAALLIISGCTITGKVLQEGCKILPDGENQEKCFKSAAVQTLDPKTCELIKGIGWNSLDGNPGRNKCYEEIAIKLKNDTICDLLGNGLFVDTKEDCISAVEKTKSVNESEQTNISLQNSSV
jgi:hypothetical protein